MTRAFAYIRVSGSSQLDGDGFPRQRAEIRAFALEQGIDIVKFFEERAVTGRTEWDDRPAWMEMMGSLNGINTIVIERLDRLARDLMVQEHIIADLRHRKIALISTAEPDLGSDDPARVLFRQIMGAIAQYDRAMIVLKLRGARRRIKASGGRGEGRVAYGQPDRHGVTRKGEADVLSMMRLARREGKTPQAITDELNAIGIVSRYGKRWIESSVRKILKRDKVTIDKGTIDKVTVTVEEPKAA